MNTTGRAPKGAKKSKGAKAGKRVGRVVTASGVLGAVVALVECLVTFSLTGGFAKRDVATLLVYAGARRTSLTQACDDLQDAMSDSRLRQLWSRFGARVVQPALNRLLLFHAKACFARRKLRLAIDLTLIPYHGTPYKNKREIYRGPAKSGTSHFHAYATVYVILAGRRFTLGVKSVRKGEDLGSVLQFLLEHVASAGLQLESLYVDRGFCNVACIRFLQTLSCEVLMPLVIRGKKGKALLKTRAGGRFTYTMTSPDHGSVAMNVVVAVVYAKGRRGEHKAKKYAYVVHNNDASSRSVYERYRTRFGIEASYRIMNRARARTATRNPVIRLVLFGVALLIENEWVWTKYTRLSTMRRGRGGRVVHDALLRFERCLAMIVHAANALLGFGEELIVPDKVHRRKNGKLRAKSGGGNY